MNQKPIYQIPIELVAKHKRVFFPPNGVPNATLSHDGTTLSIDGASNYLQAPLTDIVVVWEIRSAMYTIKYRGEKYRVTDRSLENLKSLLKSMFTKPQLLKELKRHGAKVRMGLFSWVMVVGFVAFIIGSVILQG